MIRLRAKIALERFGGLFIKVSDMKMKTNISRKKIQINNEINHPKEKESFRNENCYLECQWHQII